MFGSRAWRAWRSAGKTAGASPKPSAAPGAAGNSKPTIMQRYYDSKYYPLYRDVLTVVGWLPVALYITEHVYSLTRITGESMSPTFNPDYHKDPVHADIVVMDKWSGRYRRGDVVTLWSSTNPKMLTTKRIVALEGDVVTPLGKGADKPLKIPPGHCWVEGDSKYRTRDSNTYGPVSLTLVNSRLCYQVYPFSRSGEVARTQGNSEGRVKRLGPEWVDTR